MQEYIGCKVETVDYHTLKIIQPVLIQSFDDEFGACDSPKIRIPVKAGQILTMWKPAEVLSPEMHRKYLTGVGRLIYVSKWSRPDILNATPEV